MDCALVLCFLRLRDVSLAVVKHPELVRVIFSLITPSLMDQDFGHIRERVKARY